MKENTKRRVEKKFFLPNAVSLMDGTILPLGIAPSCDDSADYHGRKYAYSLTSVEHMKQHQRSNEFFTKGQENTSHTPAHVRVITEHTMGLWKGRFPWLRNIRMTITNDPKSLDSILKYIDATVVLHNMLIKFGDDDDKDCPWRLDEDALSDIDDPQNHIPERR
ncbi:hypothetical protein ACHAWO_009721 [Cyclotella atomus]|uniref:DDE Tnp4 domain-containing protein n=1 Tax=Cyclotella atomus TaxID=382360 RepID=A0ABD3P6K7_9STRA